MQIIKLNDLIHVENVDRNFDRNFHQDQILGIWIKL